MVRLGSLGDLIHTLPAVAALRRAHPGATIDWLVDDVHAELLTLTPAVDHVVRAGERSARGWWRLRGALRRARYDVAVDFQGLIKSAVLARLSGAAQVYGFARDALREPSAVWGYSSAVPVPAGRHVIHKNLALAAALGADTGRLEFPIDPGDSRAMATMREWAIGRFALINPGAAWPNKRWPPRQFGRVARHVAEVHGLSPVVLWGPNELDLAEAVVAESAGRARSAPETSLRDLLVLCRQSSLMVSGDTGPLHIAGACGTPLVALFGPTDPSRNGPWDAEDVALSRYETCACHYERRCRRGADGWCLPEITVESVVAAIDTRLAAAAAHAGVPRA